MKKMLKRILLVVISTFFISLIFTFYINQKIKPVLLEIATFEATKLESMVANNSLIEVLDDDIDVNSLYTTKESKDGNIEMIDFNSSLVNSFLSKLTIKIQNHLRGIDESEILTEVPIGMAFNNVIFANLGPKIPVKLHYYGDVNSSVTTKVTEYGINNALIELKVNVEISAEIMLPFITDKLVLKTDVPLAIKIIQGKIPNYYGGELIKNSSLYSLPID